MVPKWHQNGTKMAPRWPLGGSWGHLGGKMAPRWSQEGSKAEKVNSFPPCWGPCWGPILDILITRVVHKRLEDPVGLHVVSRHQFLGERGSPETWKNKQNHCTVVRFQVFHLNGKSCSGEGSGAPFWERFGGQVGPCWAPSWLKMALEHHSKNWVVKRSCGSQKVHPAKPPAGL